MLKKILEVCSFLVLALFLIVPVLNSQATADVTVNADFQSILILLVDGTDAGHNLLLGNYSTSETCNFGDVDAIGTLISNGDAMVNNVAGIPVDNTGAPIGANGPYDPNCVGSFYPILDAAGSSSVTDHPNTAIGIYALGVQADGTPFTLSVIAALTANTTNVTIDQLKWKDDATVSSGSQSYTDFSTSSSTIDSQSGILYRETFYHDYGLLVEYQDAPGTNTWTVTYTLATS